MNGALRMSVVLLLAGGGWWWWSGQHDDRPTAPTPPPPLAYDLGPYAGVDACRACHAKETEAWERSPHGRHATALVTPRRTVDAAIGSVWMQTFLARDERGYHRILPRCFDLREKRWRSVTTVLDEIRGPREDLPSITDADVKGRSFEIDCAGCHAVGTRVRMNGGSGHMQSSWRALAIDCEACHGPGRAHAEAWAQVDPGEPLASIGTLPTRDQTALCARCHGGPPTAGGFGPAEAPDFVGTLDHGRMVRADGSAVGQMYQHAAFARSPCAIEGGLTCTGCHEAHGPGLKPVPDIDRLCSNCHEAQAERAHHHHDPVKPGGHCIDCHMPRIYDGLLTHQRDHRIGVPLPATPYAPDACTACHTERTKVWAAAAARRWWGTPDLETVEAIEAVHRGRAGDLGGRLALERALTHPDAHLRVAAARLLGEAETALADTLPEVRLAAVETARLAKDHEVLRQLTHDGEVRVRAAAWLALDGLGTIAPPEAAEDLRRAAPHVRTDVELRRLLARLDLAAGRAAEAAEHLADAAAFRPKDATLWRALAEAHTKAGHEALAAEAWTQVERLNSRTKRPRR